MPFGYSPVGAEAQPGKRLIVELSMEQGQGQVKRHEKRCLFFVAHWGVATLKALNMGSHHLSIVGDSMGFHVPHFFFSLPQGTPESC